MRHYRPHNLMMPRRKGSDAAKGGMLFGCIIVLIFGLFILAPSAPPPPHAVTQENICQIYPEMPKCIFE